MEDIVCTIVVHFRNGLEKRAFLARRADPVAALDKILRRGKVFPTATCSLSLGVEDSNALTTQAAKAVVRLYSAFSSQVLGSRR